MATSPTGKTPAQQREERRAAALRANLRRRKSATQPAAKARPDKPAEPKDE